MKHSSLLILLLGLSISSVFAQNNPCDVQLNVYQNQENAAIEPETITNVVASLQNIKSQIKIKATSQNKMPYFAAVPTGTYQATISMKGYKNTTKEIELTCELSSEQKAVSEIMFLWKGNSKETVKMFGTVFTGSEDKESTDAAANSKSNKTMQVNGRAASLPQPVYPPAARVVRASGAVQVQVTIDELGRVISAKVLSGHPLLRAAAEKAAREARFDSTRLQGIPIKIVGVVVYNFVP